MTSIESDGKPSKQPSRRQFICYLGTIGATSALAGCGALNRDSTDPEDDGTETATRTPNQQIEKEPFDSYETVVNLADEGADTEANDSIASLMEENVGDDTLLYLPSGRYLMDDDLHVSEFENLGIYGEEATIVPPDGYTGPLFLLGGAKGTQDCYMEGLHFDFRNPATAPPPLIIRVDDGLLIRNISIAGTSRRTQFEVLQPDGEGLVENLHIPDGGFADEYPPGCYISAQNRGELTLRDFSIANFPNNGIYASGSTGPIRVVGGVFENNDISNVRVGDGGLIRDVEISCTNTTREHKNMRGIWVKEAGGTDATVENCTVRLEEINASDGAVVVSNGTTVRDTQIEINGDNIAAILTKDPQGADKSKEITASTTIEDTTVTGSAAGGATVTVINHDGCSFQGVSIDQTGDNRDGFEFFDVSEGVLRDPSIEVTGTPVVRNNSNIRIIRPDGE